MDVGLRAEELPIPKLDSWAHVNFLDTKSRADGDASQLDGQLLRIPDYQVEEITDDESLELSSSFSYQSFDSSYTGVRDKGLLPSPLSPRKSDTTFREMGVQTSDNSSVLGAVSVPLSESNNPLPVLCGSHAPSEYHSYAINIWGTQTVLTCTADKKIILDAWTGDKSQRFEYGLHKCFPVLSGPAAADGDHYYLGHDNSNVLVCKESKPRDWEHVYLRAVPDGGFTLWLYDHKRNGRLVPISIVSHTELRLGDQGVARFGFTRLDRYDYVETGPWGGRTLLSDSPIEGKQYAIKIYGTSKAFTRDFGYGIRLREWSNHESQRFYCRINEGFMGFQCEDRFIGFNAQATIVCSADKLLGWEYIHVRALPGGGFQLWVKFYKYQDWLQPIGEKGDDRMAVNETRAVRVSFTLLE